MKEKINEKQWKYRDYQRNQKQVLSKINKIGKLLERPGKRHDTN